MQADVGDLRLDFMTLNDTNRGLDKIVMQEVQELTQVLLGKATRQEIQKLQEQVVELTQETGSKSSELQTDVLLLRSDIDTYTDQINELFNLIGDTTRDDSNSITVQVDDLRNQFNNIQTELSQLHTQSNIGDGLEERISAIGSDIMWLMNNKVSTQEMENLHDFVRNVNGSMKMVQDQLKLYNNTQELVQVLGNSEYLDLTVCQTVPIKEHPTG